MGKKEKGLNPADAFRKQARKKELAKNKKIREVTREVALAKRDPDAIKQKIKKIESKEAQKKHLPTALETKKRQLEDLYQQALKYKKEQLVQAVFAANPRTVVVLINGGALAIEWIAANVPGIVEAFYPGEMGGPAIADVVFGDVNPSGKLPYTVFPAAYTTQSNMTNMHMHDWPGRTYRYYQETPLFEFGFGLSYTTFDIEWNDDESRVMASVGDTVSYNATVTNTGSRSGAEVVQAYISANYPGAPYSELFGFERVVLAPGESAQVFFASGADAMSSLARDGSRVCRAGTYKITLTNGVKKLEKEVVLSGETKVFRRSLKGVF